MFPGLLHALIKKAHGGIRTRGYQICSLALLSSWLHVHNGYDGI